MLITDWLVVVLMIQPGVAYVDWTSQCQCPYGAWESNESRKHMVVSPLDIFGYIHLPWYYFHRPIDCRHYWGVGSLSIINITNRMSIWLPILGD